MNLPLGRIVSGQPFVVPDPDDAIGDSSSLPVPCYWNGIYCSLDMKNLTIVRLSRVPPGTVHSQQQRI